MTKEFFKALLIRTLKTWCQAFVGAIGTTASLMSEVNWKVALSTATLAAIMCFLWNFAAGLPEVQLADTLYALDNDGADNERNFEEYDEEDDDDGTSF